jgi:hypothetical protein
LAFFPGDPLKQSLAFTPAPSVFGQEHHSHSVGARGWQLELPLFAFPGEELMRDLQKNACSVPCVCFGATSASMLQIQEHLYALFDDPARTAAFDVDDKSDPARVMFELGIVESLL